MIRERKLTLVCPRSRQKFVIAFNMDLVCRETLYLPCCDFPSETVLPTKERDEIYVNFTPISMEEVKANSLRVNGTPEPVYEGNEIIQIYCARCGFEYKRLFEA